MVKRIGIIGGGASGVLCSLHLSRLCGEKVAITICDPADELGRGRAYSRHDPEALLNVPAPRMSAWGDRPDDFLEWLQKNAAGIEKSRHWPFVPRVLYGDYLQSELAKIPSKHLRHLREKVLKIIQKKGGFEVLLESQQQEHFDAVVLATGYRGESHPQWIKQLDDEGCRIISATDLDSEAVRRLSGQVLVLGTGLSAIDVWRFLEKKSGIQLTLFSRRGLLPVSHLVSSPSNMTPVDVAGWVGASPLGLLRKARALNKSSGISWPVIADQLRSQATKIWSSWSPRQQKQFLMHIKPYWEVVRHRVPATVHEEMNEAIAQGRLQVLAGRVQSVKIQAGRIQITYRNRKSGALQEFQTDWIVLATGSEIRNELAQKGEIPGLKPCIQGMGYEIKKGEGLWAIGPALKGQLWESTAIPEIREQAAAIAGAINNGA